MLHIKFRYRDELSRGEWKEQECIVDSLEECKKIYGLGIDATCDYEIISIMHRCKYCGKYFKKEGNTRYCKVCRDNRIPESIKNKKYEQSDKGKKTRYTYRKRGIKNDTNE